MEKCQLVSSLLLCGRLGNLRRCFHALRGVLVIRDYGHCSELAINTWHCTTACCEVRETSGCGLCPGAGAVNFFLSLVVGRCPHSDLQHLYSILHNIIFRCLAGDK
jgi:hypothetical protein